MAIALFHDSVDGRQAEAGPLAHGFCGEERFEDVGLGLLVHAGPGVGHFQQHEAAGRGPRARLSGRFLHILGLDAQRPAVRHGVARIDHQIQDDLFELPRVGFYPVQLGIQNKRELDVLLDQAAEHFVQIADGLVDIEDHGLDHLLAAEHQQLAGERSRAASGLLDLLEAAAIRVRRSWRSSSRSL